MSNPANIFSFEELLRDLSTRTDSGDYAEALALLEIASSSDPGNIYIAALKRQLESLFNLELQGQLDEDRRRELGDPLPGIIECALREHQHPHAAHVPPAPAQEPPAVPPGLHAPTEETASKELEALKLLYFQRASKFVMRGEYEQALAEVRRVFVVDPENNIAREYATRVENLIEHARKLASEPIDDQPDELSDPAPEMNLTAAPEDDAHDHTSRATAWDDNFLNPAQPQPEHHPSPPVHRQTVSYGDSLSAALENRNEGSGEEHAPRRSRKSMVLVAAALLLFLGGGVVIVLSSLRAGAGEQPTASADQANPASHVSAQGTAMVISQHDVKADQKPPAETASHGAAPSEKSARVADPPAEKPKAAPPVVKEEPVREEPQAETTAPPRKEEPAPAPIPEPKPAEVEVAVPAPAFVAVEKEPQIVTLVKPQFPGFVWKTTGEGQVVIKVLIDAEGNPTDTQILKSSNPVFEEGVKDAVMKSRFAPAQMGQGPVAAWLTIPFRFKQPR